MARAQFVKKAQADIWQQGISVKRTHKHGKNAGHEYVYNDRSQPHDKNDVLLVRKGESYYHWQFMHGPVHVSRERPRESQLTQSAHKSAIFSINERIEDLTTDDMTGDGCLDDIISDIENEISECEDALSNIPDQLQEGPAGQTLQEYIDALNDLQSELEGIDVDIEEVTDDDAAQEWASMSEDDRKQFDSYEDWKKDWVEEQTEERKQSVLEEVQACSASI